MSRPKPLHKRLRSARGLLIVWRNVLRRSGPVSDAERLGFDHEMASFDDAIKATLQAACELERRDSELENLRFAVRYMRRDFADVPLNEAGRAMRKWIDGGLVGEPPVDPL